MRGAERLDDIGLPPIGRPSDKGDPQPHRGALTDAVDFQRHVGDHNHGFAATLLQTLAGMDQRDRAARTVEPKRTDFLFELMVLTAERRLPHAQTIDGVAKKFRIKRMYGDQGITLDG